MQLLYGSSDESPGAEGLGVLEGHVKLLKNVPKVPQMQWNHINVTQSSPLLKGVDNQWFYFVHSYAVEQSVSKVSGFKLTIRFS